MGTGVFECSFDLMMEFPSAIIGRHLGIPIVLHLHSTHRARPFPVRHLENNRIIKFDGCRTITVVHAFGHGHRQLKNPVESHLVYAA